MAKIRFVIEYNRQMNAADFTGFYLYPEQFGTEYVYDAKGNAKSAKALFGKAENAAYDGFNNMTAYTAPGKSAATSYS